MTHRPDNPIRLDILLVIRGLIRTRGAAQELIREGRVVANGRNHRKSSTEVPGDCDLVILPGRDFVSRGGRKLDAALDSLGVQVAGKLVLDVGASTGGFTDCVLQRGARRVIALDVGTDQLDPSLRADPRVERREGSNARELTEGDFAEPPDLVVVDASFISLEKLAPALARVIPRGRELVVLVKPQFEVGPRTARKRRGVIKERGERQRAIDSARRALEAAGFAIHAGCDSTLRGRSGNVEHFLYATRT